jgi:uncharacterized protein YdeI (YjbR/CyaY-like superfamily)
MSPSYFRSAPAFRRWLQRNHARAHELLVGFYKVTSGTPSISWTESVDAALCFGWIDGVRKRIDAERYTIRFSPRRSGSIWSAVNVRRVQALQLARRMAPAGERAFRARRANRSGRYSYEQRPRVLPAPYAGMLARNAAARRFFQQQMPSYRRAAIWWVLSPKRVETRHRRAQLLIERSAAGEWVPQFIRRQAPRG